MGQFLTKFMQKMGQRMLSVSSASVEAYKIKKKTKRLLKYDREITIFNNIGLNLLF